MFFLVFSLIFVAFAALAFLLGARKGKKYVWHFSLSRIILNILSALIAAALSGLVAFGATKALSGVFQNSAKFDSIRALELGIPLENMLAVMIAAVAAGIMFLPLFAIVRCLAKLVLKKITKLLLKLTEKKPADDASLECEVKRKKYDEFKTAKSNKLGTILGGVCGVITLLVLSTPVVGALDTVNDISYHAASASDISFVHQAGEIVDASANNAGALVVKYTGGKALFRAMTYCKADENTTSKTVKEDLVTVGEIVAVAEEHHLLSTLVRSPQTALTNEDCTAEMMLLLLENPRLNPVIDTISDFAITTILQAVHVPEDTDPLHEQFLNDMAAVTGTEEQDLATQYSNVFDRYGLREDESIQHLAAEAYLSGEDMKTWTLNNIVHDKQEFLSLTERVAIHNITDGRNQVLYAEHEARTLAHAFAVLCNLSLDMNGQKMDVQTILSKLGPALDAFAETETLGPKKTELLLIGLFQSDKVHDAVGLSVLGATDTAISICENSKDQGYEPMLISLSKAIDVVTAASDPDKDTTEAVKVMLDDLTPSSSKVLQTMSTPEVVMSYDVPEKSAVPVSGMLSDTFKNLSNAKEEGMSDEEYEKESVAVANMMEILMASGKTGTSTFGEGSVTGISAEEYVNNIMDSKVMSETVLDNVFVDGESANHDPLNTNRGMSGQEKTELLNALSNRWENSEKDDVTQKKLISVAAVLNFQIEITDGGVAEVAPRQ